MHSFAAQQSKKTANTAPSAASASAQQKLRVGPVDDPFEREAERAASAVIAGHQVPQLNQLAAQPQRSSLEGHNNALQRKETSSSGGPAEAPPIVHDVLRAPGEPLDAATRAYFEPRFGRDFASVRVHRDVRAAHSASALNADAYTVRQHIVFGTGKYEPGNRSSYTLMGHELAHTVQQSGSAAAIIQRKPRRESDEDDGRPFIVSITAYEGAKTGTATLSDQSSLDVEIIDNRLAAGEYSTSRMGPKLKGASAVGTPGSEFTFSYPVDPLTGELVNRIAPSMQWHIKENPAKQFRKLPSVAQELVTSPGGRKASQDDLAKAAHAGRILTSTLSTDELVLLDVRQREHQAAGGVNEAELDPLTFAQGVAEGRRNAKASAAGNWDTLVLAAKLLSKDPLHHLGSSGIHKLLDPDNQDFESNLGVFTKKRPMHAGSNEFISTDIPELRRKLKIFEAALISDLRSLAYEALDGAEARVLSMDRQFAGIWQPRHLAPEYFWREIQKIRHDPAVTKAALKRDQEKAAIAAQDERDRQVPILPNVEVALPQTISRMINPIYASRADERDKLLRQEDEAFTKTVAERSNLKLSQGSNAQDILSSSTADDAQSRLKNFLYFSRDRIKGARDDLSDIRVLFAADMIIDAEKSKLQKPLGAAAAEISAVIDAIASYHKSKTSIWHDILKVIEFVAMFVPGPAGWIIRGAATALNTSNDLEKLGTKRKAYYAGLSKDVPDPDAATTILSNAALQAVPDAALSLGSKAAKPLSLGLENVTRSSADDAARLAQRDAANVIDDAPTLTDARPLADDVSRGGGATAKEDLGLPTFGNIPGRVPKAGHRVELREINGRWFEIEPGTTNVKLASGEYSFATQDGRIWGSRYGHAEAASGTRVSYAGQVKFENGIQGPWSNASGTYRPAAEYAPRAGFSGAPNAVGKVADKKVQLPVFQPQTRPRPQSTSSMSSNLEQDAVGGFDDAPTLTDIKPLADDVPPINQPPTHGGGGGSQPSGGNARVDMRGDELHDATIRVRGEDEVASRIADTKAGAQILEKSGVSAQDAVSFAQGMKVTGRTPSQFVDIGTYFQLEGDTLVAGIQSAFPKRSVYGHLGTMEAMSEAARPEMIKAYLTFRQDARALARQTGARVLELQADVVMNEGLLQSLLKRGYTQSESDSSRYVLRLRVE